MTRTVAKERRNFRLHFDNRKSTFRESREGSEKVPKKVEDDFLKKHELFCLKINLCGSIAAQRNRLNYETN